MSPIELSRMEGSLRTALAFQAAFNRGEMETLLALLCDDPEFEDFSPAPAGATYSGKPAIRAAWQAFFTAWPAAHLQAEEAFGLGLHCVLRWNLTLDTARPPLRGVDIFHFKNGLIWKIQRYCKA